MHYYSKNYYCYYSLFHYPYPYSYSLFLIPYLVLICFCFAIVLILNRHKKDGHRDRLTLVIAL